MRVGARVGASHERIGSRLAAFRISWAHPPSPTWTKRVPLYVLESVYEVERVRVAELARAILGFPAIAVPDEALLLRSLEIYEQHRLHFAESYLAACAELSGAGVVASFDRGIDRVTTIRRLEPGR